MRKIFYQSNIFFRYANNIRLGEVSANPDNTDSEEEGEYSENENEGIDFLYFIHRI